MPNKKTSNNNYGASEPISAISGLIAGAKVIGAKIAAKVGAKVAAKAAIKAGGKVAAKAGGKVAAKAGGKAGTKVVDKAAKTAARSVKQTAKKATKEGLQTAKKATKETAKKARQEGIENLKMKAQNVAQKGNDKLANLTGNSPGEMTDILKQKGAQATVSAGGKIAAKAQGANNQAETDPSSYISAENTATQNGDPAMSSYSNPTGPSAYFNPKVGPSMRKGLKYDNFGASVPVKGVSQTTSGKLKSNQPIFSSLNTKNIVKDGASLPEFSSLSSNNVKAPVERTAGQKGMDFLKGFNANVNVGGFNLNIGQVASVASNLGKSASNKIKAKKTLNKYRSDYENQKQSAARAKEEVANKKIMQNIDNRATLEEINTSASGFDPRKVSTKKPKKDH